jgi:hypothetical protein
MKKLYIEPAKSSPEVVFDSVTNILSLSGQSYPENAFKFYEPLFKWVDEYLVRVDQVVEVKINLILPYVNTSSSKCIMMLLEKFENAFHAGKNIILNWYYHIDNESELECAEEFKEDLSFPFNILPRDDQ